jgi:heptosyltransferase III
MQAAVICSQGIGDGLLMMIASQCLWKKGYKVTTYQDSLPELNTWFPDHHLKKRSSLNELEKQLAIYEIIVLQNDNSPLSNAIIDLYKLGKLSNLSVFYSSYEKNKHAPLTLLDRVFDRSRSMVDNIAEAIASVLQCSEVSKNNGLVVPGNFQKNRYPKRILIHPTSTTPLRTWDAKKFIKVAQSLTQKGYEVAFCVSPLEHPEWVLLAKDRFLLPLFPSLNELAGFIYESHFLLGNESGIAHLASNLHIPTLVIASCQKQITLWRPGWFTTKVITPYRFIPNFKGLRLRQKKWQACISSKRVVQAFNKQHKKAI